MNESNIVCGFCNAKWTERMEMELERMTEGCESCGYGAEVEVSLNIICDSCQRVIYRKDGIRMER